MRPIMWVSVLARAPKWVLARPSKNARASALTHVMTLPCRLRQYLHSSPTEWRGAPIPFRFPV